MAGVGRGQAGALPIIPLGKGKANQPCTRDTAAATGWSDRCSLCWEGRVGLESDCLRSSGGHFVTQRNRSPTGHSIMDRLEAHPRTLSFLNHSSVPSNLPSTLTRSAVCSLCVRCVCSPDGPTALVMPSVLAVPWRSFLPDACATAERPRGC